MKETGSLVCMLKEIGFLFKGHDKTPLFNFYVKFFHKNLKEDLINL